MLQSFARNLHEICEKMRQGKRSPQQTRYVTENHKTVENSTNSLSVHCIQLSGRRIQKIKNEFYKIVSPISSSQPIFDIQLLQGFFFSIFHFIKVSFCCFSSCWRYYHSISSISIYSYSSIIIIFDGFISYYNLTDSLYMYYRWLNLLLQSNCFSINVLSMI